MNLEDWAFCVAMAILLGAIVSLATWGTIANRRADAEAAARKQLASINEHLQSEDREWLNRQLRLAGRPAIPPTAEETRAAIQKLRKRARELQEAGIEHTVISTLQGPVRIIEH